MMLDKEEWACIPSDESWRDAKFNCSHTKHLRRGDEPVGKARMKGVGKQCFWEIRYACGNQSRAMRGCNWGIRGCNWGTKARPVLAAPASCLGRGIEDTPLVCVADACAKFQLPSEHVVYDYSASAAPQGQASRGGGSIRPGR